MSQEKRRAARRGGAGEGPLEKSQEREWHRFFTLCIAFRSHPGPKPGLSEQVHKLIDAFPNITVCSDGVVPPLQITSRRFSVLNLTCCSQDESGSEEDSDSYTDSEEGDYFDPWDRDYIEKPDKRRYLNLASSRAESFRLAWESFM